MSTQNPTKYDPAKVYAVITDESGYVLDPSEVETWAADPDDAEGCGEPYAAYLVTGSAVPRSQSQLEDDFHRMPGSRYVLDIIAEHDLEGSEPSEVVERMNQLLALAESSRAVGQ